MATHDMELDLVYRGVGEAILEVSFDASIDCGCNDYHCPCTGGILIDIESIKNPEAPDEKWGVERVNKLLENSNTSLEEMCSSWVVENAAYDEPEDCDYY